MILTLPFFFPIFIACYKYYNAVLDIEANHEEKSQRYYHQCTQQNWAKWWSGKVCFDVPVRIQL